MPWVSGQIVCVASCFSCNQCHLETHWAAQYLLLACACISVMIVKGPFDDPKMKTIAELFRRQTGGPVGIVTTADVSDATPGASSPIIALPHSFKTVLIGLNSSHR